MAKKSTGALAPETTLVLSGVGLVLAAGLIVWASVHGAALLNDTVTVTDPATAPGTAPGTDPPGNPVAILKGLVDGTLAWTGVSSAIAGVAVAILLSAVVLIVGRTGGASDADRAAQHMAAPKQMRRLTERGVRATATRLGVPKERPAGVPLGTAVRGGAALFSSWEDMIIVLAGPRTMKSTAYAIPAIMAAPGAVLATSNKRDVVDATRGPREQLGQVWVFDPQQVATTEAAWWWNPLTYIAPWDPVHRAVRRDPATGHVAADPVKAAKLAGQIAASTRPASAKLDAYFDGAAETLLGYLLLAAAVGERPISVVARWLTNPVADEPVNLLRDHGLGEQEEALYAFAHLAEKQRDGVYGTAMERAGFLRNRAFMEWVTPPEDTWTGRPQLHPPVFVGTTDTLYLLSKEGSGSAGPLVAALTVAITEAAEELATRSPAGRLPVPLLGVLDEAANICRFKDLDNLYSHFGSRGIVMMTILQNWHQGEEVWGEKGMEKLWNAANTRIYGGGIADEKLLRRLESLIGRYDHATVSRTSGRQGHSRSRSVTERPILSIQELAALDERAVVLAARAPAVLIKPRPWFTGPDADTINHSIATHSPVHEPA